MSAPPDESPVEPPKNITFVIGDVMLDIDALDLVTPKPEHGERQVWLAFKLAGMMDLPLIEQLLKLRSWPASECKWKVTLEPVGEPEPPAPAPAQTCFPRVEHARMPPGVKECPVCGAENPEYTGSDHGDEWPCTCGHPRKDHLKTEVRDGIPVTGDAAFGACSRSLDCVCHFKHAAGGRFHPAS